MQNESVLTRLASRLRQDAIPSWEPHTGCFTAIQMRTTSEPYNITNIKIRGSVVLLLLVLCILCK